MMEERDTTTDSPPGNGSSLLNKPFGYTGIFNFTIQPHRIRPSFLESFKIKKIELIPTTRRNLRTINAKLAEN